MSSKTFAQYIVKRRQQLGINRTEFLRRINDNRLKMHMTTLRRLENGDQELKASDLQIMLPILETTFAETTALLEDPANEFWTSEYNTPPQVIRHMGHTYRLEKDEN